MEQQADFIVVFSILGIFFLCAMQALHTRQGGFLSASKKDNTPMVFVYVCLIAIAVRMAVGYTMPGYVTDMDCFRSWANISYEGGYAAFYNGEYFADYPPLYIYVLSFLGWIRDVAGMQLTGADYGLLIKMPALLTDIVVAAAVFTIARKEMNGKAGVFLSCLILLNPAVMMNSAVWGQVDIIFTALILLMVWLLYKKKLIWAAVAFMFAFLFKPQAVLLAPILLFVFIRNIIVSREKGKAVLTLAASAGAMAALFFLVPLPFGVNNEPLWLVNRYVETMGQYPYATLNAFNLYGLLGLNFVENASVTWLSLPLNVWGFIFIAAICAFVLWLYVKKPQKEFLFALSGLLIFGVFTFSHGMHERYVFPAPFFFLISYILTRDKRMLLTSILFFAVVLAGQAVALYYYQTYIPQEWTVVCSAFTLAAFAFAAYTMVEHARGRPALQEKCEPRAPQAKQPCHPMQIETKRHIGRKDVLLMAVISAVYAAVAFTNLGAFEIPQTNTTLTADAHVEFEEVEHIRKIKYYAGFGEGGFALYASENGQDFTNVTLVNSDNQAVYEVEHLPSMLYKWQEFTVDFNAKYINVQKVTGNLPVHEMAFYNEGGELVLPARTEYAGGELSALFDEQALVPEHRTYITDFYFDEIYHVRTAYENIHGIEPYEWTHPPLGKVLIAAGIKMFGMNPFGWRFMGTLTGVIMLPVFYVFAKLLFKQRKYAVFATLLLAVDFMHFAQTRIGTIDSYSILWIMLMYLFMYMYTQTNFNTQGVKPTVLPLFLCGLFFGIGAATKWLCIYAGLGLLAIFLLTIYKRWKEYRYAVESGEYPGIAASYKKNLLKTLLLCVGFFIVIPGLVYIASYAPYFMTTDGSAYTGLSDIVANQQAMLSYHGNLAPETVHPFSSMWYTWPADVRPVLFFSYQNAQAGTVSTLSTMGNPLLWWAGIVAVFCLAFLTISKKKYRNPRLLFLMVAALSQYVPWMFISREVYIYHYFATVPFLILLIVYWLRILARDYKYGRLFGYVFVGACILFFALFYPVITGVPAPSWYVEGLRWLGSWPFY
ncbi:MAG TPA: hypothetical protein DEB31_10965 [Clostridiales bacterium]|nr:hypothetical protein [Clostridiales bacterium]